MPDLARMRRCKEVTALELSYVAGILPNTSVWPPGMGPLPPKKWSANGRPTKLMRRDDKDRPCSVKELALGLPKQAWRNVKWRESSADFLTARFARLRVRPAHRDYWLSERHAEEWLLIEWPDDESEPTKYWFSTLPENISFRALVGLVKLRWRIERDYQELKQEVGLRYYERRVWRGFHHHATLCIAAYGFLISERETIPPSDLVGPRSSKKLRFPKIKSPAALPLRTERHMPNSIATMRRRLASVLVRRLHRCPCCAIQIEAHAPS
jgi:SRSO17 transposase